MKKYFIIAVLGIVCFFGISSHKAEAADSRIGITVTGSSSVTTNSATLHGRVHTTSSHHGGFLGLVEFWHWPLTPYFTLAGPGEGANIPIRRYDTSTSSWFWQWIVYTPGGVGGHGFQAPDMSSGGPYSYTLRHLACGTTYTYDVTATAAADAQNGATSGSHPLSFTTNPCPVPSSVSMTSVTLGSISTARFAGRLDLGDAPDATMGFEYGPSSTSGYPINVTAVVPYSYVCSGCSYVTNTSSPTIWRIDASAPSPLPYNRVRLSWSEDIAPAPLGGGNFVADISSLTCGVSYRVRAWMRTSGGTGYSPDSTFTVPCSVPSVLTHARTYSGGGYSTMTGGIEPPVDAITIDSVTLHGGLRSSGGAPSVNAGFVYGSTMAYGSTTPSVSVAPPTGVGVTAFTQTITGLTCGQTYQYAAYAINTSATVYGENRTFSTTPCGSPAVETSLPTIGSGPTPGASWFYATFHGTLTYLGGFPSATVSFRYGPTTAYGTTVPATGTGVMSTLGVFSSYRIGLPCGTYHWQAVATGPGGIAYGVDRTFNGCAEVRPGDDIRGDDTPRPGTGGEILTIPGGRVIDPFSVIGREIEAYFAEVFALALPSAPIPLASSAPVAPSIVFLVNGTPVATVASGSSAVLSWEMTNIKPGTCNGTSSPLPFATGWNNVPKAPTTALAPDVPVTFTEVVTGITTLRKYILNGCEGTDGSKLNDREYSVTVDVAPVETSPKVTTAAASKIGATFVTLNDHVTSLGGASSVTVGFEFGKTTSYGNTTEKLIVPSTATLPTSDAISITSSEGRLEACTLYHYRAFATSLAGTGYGSDMTFTTNNLDGTDCVLKSSKIKWFEF